jgi:hypothetical protein
MRADLRHEYDGIESLDLRFPAAHRRRAPA